MQDNEGDTALHFACFRKDMDDTVITSIVYLLLQTDFSPLVSNTDGEMPLIFLQRYHTTYKTTIALLEQALAATEVTSLLVKARRLVVATTIDTLPPYLQSRVERGQDLPRVALVPETEKGENRKLRTTLAFLLEMGGERKGEGMPRDLFRGIFMDLFMSVWDPLRRKRGHTELAAYMLENDDEGLKLLCKRGKEAKRT